MSAASTPAAFAIRKAVDFVIVGSGASGGEKHSSTAGIQVSNMCMGQLRHLRPDASRVCSTM